MVLCGGVAEVCGVRRYIVLSRLQVEFYTTVNRPYILGAEVTGETNGAAEMVRRDKVYRGGMER